MDKNHKLVRQTHPHAFNIAKYLLIEDDFNFVIDILAKQITDGVAYPGDESHRLTNIIRWSELSDLDGARVKDLDEEWIDDFEEDVLIADMEEVLIHNSSKIEELLSTACEVLTAFEYENILFEAIGQAHCLNSKARTAVSMFVWGDRYEYFGALDAKIRKAESEKATPKDSKASSSYEDDCRLVSDTHPHEYNLARYFLNDDDLRVVVTTLAEQIRVGDTFKYSSTLHLTNLIDWSKTEKRPRIEKIDDFLYTQMEDLASARSTIEEFFLNNVTLDKIDLERFKKLLIDARTKLTELEYDNILFTLVRSIGSIVCSERAKTLVDLFFWDKRWEYFSELHAKLLPTPDYKPKEPDGTRSAEDLYQGAYQRVAKLYPTELKEAEAALDSEELKNCVMELSNQIEKGVNYLMELTGDQKTLAYSINWCHTFIKDASYYNRLHNKLHAFRKKADQYYGGDLSEEAKAKIKVMQSKSYDLSEKDLKELEAFMEAGKQRIAEFIEDTLAKLPEDLLLYPAEGVRPGSYPKTDKNLLLLC